MTAEFIYGGEEELQALRLRLAKRKPFLIHGPVGVGKTLLLSSLLILGKVMGVSMERPENLMVFLPQSGALRLLASKDQSSQQAALLQGQVFLNAQPITIWLNGAGPQLAANGHADDTSVNAQSDPGTPRRRRCLRCKSPISNWSIRS